MLVVQDIEVVLEDFGGDGGGGIEVEVVQGIFNEDLGGEGGI